MVNLPPSIIGICIGLGIDLSDPAWVCIIQEFLNSNPLVDDSDFSTLSHLRQHLSSRIQMVESPPSPSEPGPATEPQQLLWIFHDIGQQLWTNLSTSVSSGKKASTLIKVADPQ